MYYLGNANSISVVKSGAVNLSDTPFVVSGNALTGPFVLNFLFNTDRAAAATATDGGTENSMCHAVEFAVGLVTSLGDRDLFNASNYPMKYGIMINTTAYAFVNNAGNSNTAAATVYCKGDTNATALGMGPSNVGTSLSPAFLIGNGLTISNSSSAVIKKGGNHSLQIKFDGTNMSYYVDGVLMQVTGAVAGSTFTPTNKGPFYLVMSFANADQFSSIPAGQTTPPTNFTLQVTMSEIFGGTNNLLGTTLTHLQTFNTSGGLNASASPGAGATASATAALTNGYIAFTKDTVNSSAATAEINYATGVFTYIALDNASRAMVNLTINFTASTANVPFVVRYLLFSSSAIKITGPNIPSISNTVGTAHGISMKVSFIMSSGDQFIIQGWGPIASFAAGSSIIVEKLPVAQGGGGQLDHRWVNVHPIPKRHPSRKSSLRISKSSTKKGNRK